CVGTEAKKPPCRSPNEPATFSPPLAMWKRIYDLRKNKYEMQSLPDDPKGRKEADDIYKLLSEEIETKPFQTQMTLKEFLGMLYETLSAKGKELPILIDTNAFKEADPDAEDIYDTQIQFEKFPQKLTIATALRMALSKVKTNNATYLIRRNFIEVTTNDRMVKDRVLRVYPVGDLVIPIGQGQIGTFGVGGFNPNGGGFNGVFGGGGFGG